MRLFSRASLLAPVLAAATAATAADLPRRGPPPDYYAPPPVFSWTGFYVGLNAGGSIGSWGNGGSYQLYGSKPAGIIGGLTGGYNFQIAPNLIIGAEADINGSSYSSSNTLPFFGFSGGAKMNALLTVRGRLGYSMDRALFYVTGGLATGKVAAYVNDVRGFPFWGSQSTWQSGYTIGGGLEYAFMNNFSAKVEYLYTSIGPSDYFSYTQDYSRIGNDFSTIRAGVNYHF